MDSPLDLLFDYERRGSAHVVDLSTEEDRREYWRSIVFRVKDNHLLLDEHDASELLTMPSTASVPGTKRWVTGVANVRGELLPIVDFGDFLFGEPTKLNKQSRVLVIEMDEVRSGLLVDQVFGVRAFPVDTYQTDVSDKLPEDLRAVVEGNYREENIFHVMSVKKLIENTGFMQAAA